MSSSPKHDLQVKICGITNPYDARLSSEAGADALGFNFFSGSSRALIPADALPWIRDLGPTVLRVAVVVNPDGKLLAKLLAADCFDWIQFHGDETPEFCAASGFKFWVKAIRVMDHAALEKALEFETPELLLDAWRPDAYGGTGTRLDWDLVRNFVAKNSDRKFLLAGGLNAHNVRQAVRIVRPHGVDVASGVELTPGKKEEYLVREFVRIAKMT
ncbi:MAG: phosphoribosylanthranilate isomerase [Verrucomicrobiaceae bacterium]|nr:MAG: phosphoribosylanthranilate isomerase [Verrucomicrobiaceae bacterium]